jgi:hypothetical protein
VPRRPDDVEDLGAFHGANEKVVDYLCAVVDTSPSRYHIHQLPLCIFFLSLPTRQSISSTCARCGGYRRHAGLPQHPSRRIRIRVVDEVGAIINRTDSYELVEALIVGA